MQFENVRIIISHISRTENPPEQFYFMKLNYGTKGKERVGTRKKEETKKER